ncbi:hypothetical protein NXS15_01230 [Mycoplasma sp. CSL7475-4]|uniref:hypothetical protein n=1 Tax=Mycoplasma sp. CSL7475-4 TaxID=2973942 RepID=UPI00216B3FAC|nr:hypothetical protein [Mycoplasma sp. CSL7475-4]MCS4536753.1 hypothetical protein [Mycoplasma sp. CSL7475-4]
MIKNKNNNSWFDSLAKFMVSKPAERPSIFNAKNRNPLFSNFMPEFDYRIAKQEINTKNWNVNNTLIASEFVKQLPEIATEGEIENLMEALATKKLLYRFYNQERIAYVYNFTFKSITYSFVAVVLNIWKNAKIKLFFKDDNKGKILPQILKVVQLRSGYVFAMCKINETLQLVKFNNFIGENSDSDMQVRVLFTSLFPADYNFDNFRDVAFSESFNNENKVDVLIHDQQGYFWYGQIDTNITNNKNEWVHYSPVYIGKQDEQFNPHTRLRISDLNSMLISTMTRKENNENVFYGNAVLGISQGSQTFGFSSIIKEHKAFETFNGDTTKPNERMRGEFGELFREFIKFKLKPKDIEFTTKSFNWNIEIIDPIVKLVNPYRNGLTPEDQFYGYGGARFSSADIRQVKHLINAITSMHPNFVGNIKDHRRFTLINHNFHYNERVDIPAELLNLGLQDPQNFNFEIETEISDFNVLVVILKFAGQVVKRVSFKADLKRKHFFELESFKIRTNVSVDIVANIANTTATSSRLFKLTFSTFDKSPNGLIFAVDKGIDNIHHTSQGTILGDAEIAVPVFTNQNDWKVYSFFNNSKFDENGTFIEQEPRELGTIANLEQNDDPVALAIREDKHSSPYLFIVHNNGIHAFNGLYQGNNSPYNLNLSQRINLANLLVYREQNIVKFLVLDNDVPKFLNLKYDQKPFNLSNVPWLYKALPLNNLSDNLNVVLLQDEELNFCISVKDKTVTENTLNLSATLKQTSLNTGNAKANATKFQWLDNLGNVAFEYNDTLSAKTSQDNYQINAHIPFGYQYEQNNNDKQRANAVAKMWIDPNAANELLHTHMRFKFTDGENTKTIVSELGNHLLTTANNRAFIRWKLGLKKETGKVKKFYDFEIGNALTNTFRKMGQVPEMVLDENFEGAAMVHEYVYEFFNFGKNGDENEQNNFPE